MEESEATRDPSRCSPSIRVADVSSDQPLKRCMADWYSEFSKTYNDMEWHEECATKLVEGLEINKGDRILDLACGTALAGMAALERSGETGSLVGVDISLEMLKVALTSCEERELENVELVLGDAQKLDLEENSFNVVICSLGLMLFPDEKWTLTYWKKFLIPGGRLAVHCLSEDSHIQLKLIQKAAAEFGIEFVMGEPTGTVEKCQKLFADSGFTSIVITEDVGGKYLTLEHVIEGFDKLIDFPLIQLPTRTDDATIESIKERYIKLAKEHVEAEKGIWNKNTMMYIYARKPMN